MIFGRTDNTNTIQNMRTDFQELFLNVQIKQFVIKKNYLMYQSDIHIILLLQNYPSSIHKNKICIF